MRQNAVSGSAIDLNGEADATTTTNPAMTRALWLLIGLMAIVLAISMVALRLGIDIRSNPALVGISLGYAGLTLFYTRIRPDPRLASILTVVGQLFLVLLIGLLLTYAATAVALPLRDAELFAADRWIGFDREAFRNLIGSSPLFGQVLDAAYLSIQPQTALVPLALILSHQLPRLQRFVMAFALALLATTAIAVFIPAHDAAIYVDLAPHGIAALPSGVYTHIPTLEALRHGTMHSIRLDNLEGLLTFPSFHTANAILFAWAVWKIRYVATISLVVNGLMILSTPISGSHYVVDLIGGSVVAIAAIIAANRIGLRLQAKAGHTLRPADQVLSRPLMPSAQS